MQAQRRRRMEGRVSLLPKRSGLPCIFQSRSSLAPFSSALMRLRCIWRLPMSRYCLDTALECIDSSYTGATTVPAGCDVRFCTWERLSEWPARLAFCVSTTFATGRKDNRFATNFSLTRGGFGKMRCGILRTFSSFAHRPNLAWRKTFWRIDFLFSWNALGICSKFQWHFCSTQWEDGRGLSGVFLPASPRASPRTG